MGSLRPVGVSNSKNPWASVEEGEGGQRKPQLFVPTSRNDRASILNKTVPFFAKNLLVKGRILVTPLCKTFVC